MVTRAAVTGRAHRKGIQHGQVCGSQGVLIAPQPVMRLRHPDITQECDAAPTEGNQQLQLTLSEINQDLGGGEMPALDPLQRGAADISFVAPYTSALAGLGTPGGGGHSPGEYLDLSQLPMATKRAAILLYRLADLE